MESNENNKINFEPSGYLARESNNINGIFLKYTKPIDSCMPIKKWKFYVFKYNKNMIENHLDNNFHVYNSTIPLFNYEYYLIGNNARIANIHVKDDSVQEQHAVIQHKLKKNEIPTIYIIDLDSSHGTFVNNERIESRRYYELFEKDLVRFGSCKDEYILLHDEICE